MNRPAPKIQIPKWALDCRQSLGDYYIAVNHDYGYVPYQQEVVVPALEGLERGDYDRLMIFMPSRHAKSDISTKAFIPWFLGRNPFKNVILLCHTQPLANDFGSYIRDVMTKNDHHRVIFPEVRVDSKSTAKDFFKTNRGNSFYAFGINAGVPGRGGDLVWIDDPIANLEDAQSELIQHNLFETYKAVIKQRLQAHGKIGIAMTRWAMRDIAGRILEEEGKRWKVLVLKAQESDPDKCDGCKLNLDKHNCTAPYLWEDHYGRERYEEAKQDAYIWEAMWQQSPQPRLNQGFMLEWLRFYLPKGARPEYRDDPEGGPPVLVSAPVDFDKLFKLNTYIFVDPAMGKEAAHDRTCILVIAAGPEGKLFLVDGILDRIDAAERIDELVRLIRLWKPRQVGYEEYALAADTVFLNRRLKEENFRDTIITSLGRKAIPGMNGGRLKKHERIIQLQPAFRDGKIWFPKKMVRKLQDGGEIDIISYAINKEILGYAGEGSVPHEDFLDCLSRIYDSEIMMDHREREEDEENWDSGSEGNGSWESTY